MREQMIAIIGVGNMGGSLLQGLINQDYPGHQLMAVDTDARKLTELQQSLHISTTQDLTTVAKEADVILLALKPQIIKNVISQIKPHLNHKRQLVISIAAGITIASLEKWLGQALPMVRAMPNTPALINCGVTGLFANAQVNSTERDVTERILGAVGSTYWLPKESCLDIVTALSGSGPAYFFYIMEALSQAATELGLPAELSLPFTLQTAYGATMMAIESDKSLADLRKQVTSPGGTTEKALQIFQQKELAEIIKAAVMAAKQRSEELAKVTD